MCTHAHPMSRRSAVVVLAACLAAAGPTGVAAQAHGARPSAVPAPTATEGVDYRVYDRVGTPASFADILAATGDAEVLLVGEEHDDMPGHAFEAALLEAAIARYGHGPDRARPVVLSLEMFERDVQYIVDEYLADLISEDHFLRSARPWDDYQDRYRPMVEAAKASAVPVVAANAPRRYVNKVTRDGPESLETLSTQARSYLPPLPYPGPSERYRAEWNAIMAEAMAASAEETPETAEPPPSGAASEDSEHEPHPSEPSEVEEASADHTPGASAIYGQALWDAAMGHAVATALVEHLGALVIHVAGSFHVARGTGIPERIDDYRPGARVMTVVITKAEAIDAWSLEDHADIADFVVLTKRAEAEPSASR